MLTGNKGDWSEIYALFKLIADGTMQKGDNNLLPAPGETYKIISLTKQEKAAEAIYELDGNEVKISRGDRTEINTRAEFKTKATELLASIKQKRSEKDGAFAIPAIETFMNEILTHSIKAGSGDKTDLSVKILDHRTTQEHMRGFSIKSQLGGKSTLLNASKTNTWFRYKIDGKEAEEALNVNDIKTGAKIQLRVKALEKLQGEGKLTVSELGPVSDCFQHNLTIIDDALPAVISSLLWNGYRLGKMKLCEILPFISEHNPRGYAFNDLDTIYSKKIKQLLVSSALGMMPATVWDGEYQTTGGYLVVLRSGEVVSYHFYDRQEFETYLFKHTALESPSSKRHEYALVKRDDDGSLYFDLCLQIRFYH